MADDLTLVLSMIDKYLVLRTRWETLYQEGIELRGKIAAAADQTTRAALACRRYDCARELTDWKFRADQEVTKIRDLVYPGEGPEGWTKTLGFIDAIVRQRIHYEKLMADFKEQSDDRDDGKGSR